LVRNRQMRTNFYDRAFSTVVSDSRTICRSTSHGQTCHTAESEDVFIWTVWPQCSVRFCSFYWL